ncbi:DUF669 domain-containing protein [Levilactobacillus namurensis]|uniref:DUF669 domain-containing protein n=1 Tax=Levilactobacillus namurensis TaxID=380393 RepID=UPI000465B5FC|nr:DUF669 domain-containing protein [Levilactobacillus namurensis]
MANDFMNTNYANNTSSSYDPLPTGTYEMIINKAQESATKNGAETLQIDLLVRNDLDKVPGLANTNGKYHNRHVFMDNWKRKATNQYDLDGFQYILQAAGVPENTAIPTVEDFMKAITGTPVKVYVKAEQDTYKGETRLVNRVAPWNFEVSDYPQIQHVYKNKRPATKPAPQAQPATNTDDPFANTGTPVNISDDDLPF